MPNEKFILTVRELHFGYIKETFRRGAVIEHDEAAQRLVIDGRRFDDTRDLDILKRHEWVVPYSQEALDEVRGITDSGLPQPKKQPKGTDMEIVQSDADAHETIDIRHTQTSKRNAEAKEASRDAAKQREKDHKMEIIKGDETVEERIASLKGKSDMNSMAERVRLKRQAATMPIVHDDSLGAGVGKSEIPMNAGQHFLSREEVEARTEEKRLEAEARKKQVTAARAAAGIDVPSENAAEPALSGDVKRPAQVKTEIDQFQTPKDAAQDMAKEGIESPRTPSDGLGVSDGAVDALMVENAELRTENANLKSTQNAILARLEALEAPKAPVAADDGVERAPVTDEATAEKVLEEQGA